MMVPDTVPATQAVETVDARVLAKRDQMRAFEKSFNKVCARCALRPISD